ncbi:MAG: OmpA family protein [Alphaproteobacteria bacterium]
MPLLQCPGRESTSEDWVRRSGRLIAAAMLISVGVLFGGCDTTSEIVDAVNPINLFEDDGEEDEETAVTADVPGEDEDYPAIGSVPDAPETPAISLEGDIVREGLVADKQHARHTDQVIRHAELPKRVTPLPQQTDALASAPEDPPAVSIENGQTQVQRTAPEPQPVQQSVSAANVPEAGPVAEEASAVGLTSRDPVTGVADQPAVAAATVPPAEPLVRRTDAAEPAPAPEPEPITVNSGGIEQAASPPPSAAPLAQNNAAAAGNSTSASASRPASGEIQHVATIYFPKGGAKLTETDRRVIAQVIDLFRAGASRIRIVGHASKGGVSDPERQNLVNYKSSLDRATSVAREFLVHGVLQQQIEISAVGAQQPRYSEDTPAGVAGNQRAEVFLKY